MSHRMPMCIKEYIKLEDVGIYPASVGYSALTFEYDTSIYMRAKIADAFKVVVFDMTNGHNPIRRTFSVDSAIMNPAGEFIALKDGNRLEIFSIRSVGYTTHKMYTMEDENVIFWKWITKNIIALITDSSVHHWNIDADLPEKIFTSDAALNDCKITDYRTDSEQQFLLLAGISAEVDDQQEGRVVKKFQSHSMDTGLNYCFDACAATVGQVMMSGNPYPSKLICAVYRKASHYKLCLDQVAYHEKNKIYDRKTMHIVLEKGGADYPEDIQVIQKYDIVCVITLHCFIHLYHMETATCIYRTRITNDTIFITTPKFDETGFLAVTASRKVYSIEVEESTLIPYIKDTIALPHLALRIAVRNNLSGAENLVQAEFDRLLQCDGIAEAANFVASSPKGCLRTMNTIQKFKKINYIDSYFRILTNHGRLTKTESIEFITNTLISQESILTCYEQDLEWTKDLGDLIDDDTLAVHAYLRTYLPEELVDVILQNEIFSGYTRLNIGEMCRTGQLFQIALRLQKDHEFVKKALSRAHLLDPTWILNYFDDFSVEKKLEYIKVMLHANIDQNLENCIKIAIRYKKQLTIEKLIEIFEDFKCYRGLFDVLKSEVNTSNDLAIQFRFIHAACKLGYIEEAKDILRERECEIASEARPETYMPLITMYSGCDYAHDLVLYLERNFLFMYIDDYVKVNPHRLPAVIGGILDTASFAYCKNIKELITSVEGWFSIDELVEVVEKRDKRSLLQKWLETCIKEGSTKPIIHTTLAKIYIDSDKDMEKFLCENQYYESKAIGEYCQERGKPELACMAYERGCEILDSIGVCNQNSLFEIEARNLVRLKCSHVWDEVLSKSNFISRQVVDVVVNSNLFGTTDENEIQTTVRALLENNLAIDCMKLLEKIISIHPETSDKYDFQTLLILTAIEKNKSKVMEYIKRFDNYVVSKIAGTAINAGLHEEVDELIKKFDVSPSAILGIINMSSTDWIQAEMFCERYKEREFRTTFHYMRSFYNCEVDFDKCPVLSDKKRKKQICNWLKELSEVRIFHRNSDYLDMKILFKNIPCVMYKCEKCLWHFFNKEKKTLKKLPEFEDDSYCIGLIFNVDLSNILLTKDTNHITFPETDSLSNFGPDNFLFEKFSFDSFIKIETKALKKMKCFYLFGVIMWRLPQRSKYSWHKLNTLKNNPDIDGVVLEVLEQIKGKGHLPLVLEDEGTYV